MYITYIQHTMNSTTINIKTEPEIKEKAQETAHSLGFSLSAVLNGFLRQFIRTRTVYFSDKEPEIPTQYFLDAIKQGKKELKEGKTSPDFRTGEELVYWLEKQGI